MAKKFKKARLGQVVDDFTLENSQGAKVQPARPESEFVVLYFYPKDDTPGCTLEGQQFNEALAKFKKAGAEIYGVSRDSVKSHDKFKCKYGYKFELLSDPEEIACDIFDVIKEKNMYGKKVMGIERSTFILNKKGELLAEFRKVKADGHAAEIFEKIKSLRN